MGDQCVFDGFFKVHKVAMNNGRTYEVVRATDSVNVLIFCQKTKQVVLIRQPRAAMITKENPEGQIVETVAGRCDDGLPPLDLISKEAKEELGITLDPKRIEFANKGMPMAVSAGMTNERVFAAIAYIEPNDLPDPNKIYGNAAEGECIQPVIIDLDELGNYVFDDVRSFALAQYFLRLILQTTLNIFL